MENRDKKYLIDYINAGYTIVTSQSLTHKIKKEHPKAKVFCGEHLDGIPSGDMLVDSFYAERPAVIHAKLYQKKFVIEYFTTKFVEGEDDSADVKEDKIVIELTGGKNPPRLLINGEHYPVNEIDYSYVTADEYGSGSHEICVKYYDKQNNPGQYTVKGFERIR